MGTLNFKTRTSGYQLSIAATFSMKNNDAKIIRSLPLFTFWSTTEQNTSTLYFQGFSRKEIKNVHEFSAKGIKKILHTHHIVITSAQQRLLELSCSPATVNVAPSPFRPLTATVTCLNAYLLRREILFLRRETQHGWMIGKVEVYC